MAASLHINVAAEPSATLRTALLFNILPILALVSALFSTTETLPLKLYKRKLLSCAFASTARKNKWVRKRIFFMLNDVFREIQFYIRIFYASIQQRLRKNKLYLPQE